MGWHRIVFSFTLSTSLSSLGQLSNPRLGQEPLLHHSDFSHRNVKHCGEKKKSYFLNADVSAISDSCQPISIPSGQIAVWEALQFCTRSLKFIYLDYLLGIFLVAI